MLTPKPPSNNGQFSSSSLTHQRIKSLGRSKTKMSPLQPPTLDVSPDKTVGPHLFSNQSQNFFIHNPGAVDSNTNKTGDGGGAAMRRRKSSHGLIIPESEMAKVFAEVRESMERKQKGVMKVLGYVKERVNTNLENLEKYYEKKDQEAEERKKSIAELVDDGVFEFDAPFLKEDWKADLKYLQPKYRGIGVKIEDKLAKLSDKKLSGELQVFLNDFRRMFLHTKYLNTVESSPVYLDDIKCWIAHLEEDHEPLNELIVPEMYLGTMESVKKRIAHVSDLQDKVSEIHKSYEEISAAEREAILRQTSSLHEEEEKLLDRTMDPDSLSKTNVAQLREDMTDLVTAVAVEQETTADVQAKIMECMGSIEEGEARVQEMAQLDVDQKEFELKMSKHAEFQDKVLEGFVKVMDVLYSFVNPLLQEEEEDNEAIADLRSEMRELEEIVKASKSEMEKAGLAPCSRTVSVKDSHTGKSCENPALLELVTSAVTSYDTFLEAGRSAHAGAREEMAEFNKYITEFKSKVMGDVYKARQHLELRDVPVQAILVKVHQAADGIVGEVGRLMSKTKHRRRYMFLLDHFIKDLRLDLEMLSGGDHPMLAAAAAAKGGEGGTTSSSTRKGKKKASGVTTSAATHADAADPKSSTVGIGPHQGSGGGAGLGGGAGGGGGALLSTGSKEKATSSSPRGSKTMSSSASKGGLGGVVEEGVGGVPKGRRGSLKQHDATIKEGGKPSSHAADRSTAPVSKKSVDPSKKKSATVAGSKQSVDRSSVAASKKSSAKLSSKKSSDVVNAVSHKDGVPPGPAESHDDTSAALGGSPATAARTQSSSGSKETNKLSKAEDGKTRSSPSDHTSVEPGSMSSAPPHHGQLKTDNVPRKSSEHVSYGDDLVIAIESDDEEGLHRQHHSRGSTKSSKGSNLSKEDRRALKALSRASSAAVPRTLSVPLKDVKNSIDYHHRTSVPKLKNNEEIRAHPEFHVDKRSDPDYSSSDSEEEEVVEDKKKKRSGVSSSAYQKPGGYLVLPKLSAIQSSCTSGRTGATRATYGGTSTRAQYSIGSVGGGSATYPYTKTSIKQRQHHLKFRFFTKSAPGILPTAVFEDLYQGRLVYQNGAPYVERRDIDDVDDAEAEAPMIQFGGRPLLQRQHSGGRLLLHHMMLVGRHVGPVLDCDGLFGSKSDTGAAHIPQAAHIVLPQTATEKNVQ